MKTTLLILLHVAGVLAATRFSCSMYNTYPDTISLMCRRASNLTGPAVCSTVNLDNCVGNVDGILKAQEK